MKKARQLSVWALAAALSTAFLVQADSHTDKAPPNLADTWVVHVRHGHEGEFEAAFKAHVEARKAVGDPRAWQVYTPVVGEDFGHYVIRSCCFEWADQDAYDAWSLESNMGEHWNQNVHAHVKRYAHYLNLIDFENSHWPQDVKANFVGVTVWDVKPGGYGPMSAARVALSKAAKEHGWTRHWSWSESVGGQGALIIASPYKNYADMAPPEPSFFDFVSEKLGAEEAQKLFSEFSSNLSPGTYTVYRHRADLSMAPAEE